MSRNIQNQKSFFLDPSPEICIPCKGSKYLCGRNYCPLLIKLLKYSKVNLLNSEIIEGTSPPSIFVGRQNYPKVRVGPLLPAKFGETEIYDIPEAWINLRIEDILNFRYELIRSYKQVNVNTAIDPEYWIVDIQDILLSSKGIDLSIKLMKKPSKAFLQDDILPPMGPSAPFEKFEVLSIGSSEKYAEKVYYDYDLNATKAMIYLYNNGVYVSRISKLLSAGMLGFKKERKLVPTRWSITAVDDTISKNLVSKIKDFPEIGKIRVFHKKLHLNNFIVVMFPEKWSYEWIEAWYPNTTWNVDSNKVSIESDYEGYFGRKDYAKLGGCYYSVRLAVSEYLFNQRRQAKVLAIREILPGFITSTGVWFVRESIRNLLKEKYLEFDDFKEAFEYILKNLSIKKEDVFKYSKIIKFELIQSRINKFN